MQPLRFILATLLSCGVANVVSAEQPSVQVYAIKYCVSCHGPEKNESDLRLDNLVAERWDDYSLLDDIATRIEEGEMPPEDAPTPLADAEKSSFLAQLKTRLTALDKAQLAGEYKKLTAHEYNNTLVDLFGAPVEKLRDLPFDSEHDVKKIGEHQVVTSFAVKKYYDVARAYLDQHILVDVPAATTTVYTPQSTPKKFVNAARFNWTPVGPLAGSGNTPRFMLRSPVTSIATEGEYELTFDWQCFYLDPGQRFDPEKEYPTVKAINPPIVSVGTRVPVLNAVAIQKGNGRPDCRIDQPIRLVLDKDTKFLSFHVNNNAFKSIVPDPRIAEIANSDLDKKEKDAALKALQRTIKKEKEKKPQLKMLITRATFRGPINRQEPAAHRLIFGELKRDDAFESYVPLLKSHAMRLFRRPVDDDAMQKYLTLARAEYDRTNNTYAAVKASLIAMLCSPHFVFKYEGNQPQLDDYMIASRLSYFLHNSAPDEELLALAADGKLTDPAVRREQALRLLADREKAARFTRNFTHGWLGLDKFGQFSPNEAYIRGTDFAKIKPSIEQEPYAFFDEVLFGNLSAANFIDSDFVVWDRSLASLCQSNVARLDRAARERSDGFQKLELIENTGRTRGGLVTMPSIMSLTSDGENQQPILRGVWVARHLLGMEIDPPATVPAIEVNLENVSKPREILAKHKSDQSCYVCHVKFDYMGLALENYDVLGRFKDKYVHPVQDEKGKFKLVTKDPIDSISETPAGEAMPGVEGLKAHLMDRKETVMRHLVETLFEYALGREVRYRDREQIAALLKKMRENEYRLRDAVLVLVEAESFICR